MEWSSVWLPCKIHLLSVDLWKWVRTHYSHAGMARAMLATPGCTWRSQQELFSTQGIHSCHVSLISRLHKEMFSIGCRFTDHPRSGPGGVNKQMQQGGCLGNWTIKLDVIWDSGKVSMPKRKIPSLKKKANRKTHIREHLYGVLMLLPHSWVITEKFKSPLWDTSCASLVREAPGF